MNIVVAGKTPDQGGLFIVSLELPIDRSCLPVIPGDRRGLAFMSSRFARRTPSARQALSAGQPLSADMAASQEAAKKRASREIEQARFSTFEMPLIKFVSALMACNLPPAKYRVQANIQKIR
jgi:hypothetical protein